MFLVPHTTRENYLEPCFEDGRHFYISFLKKMQIFAGFLHMTSICAGYQMNRVHTLTPGVLPVSMIPILTGV